MDIEMKVETAPGKLSLTILRPTGRIDGSNYESLINRVSQLYASGTRSLLLDLTSVDFLSSAGLVALHSIVLILRGEAPTSGMSGWDALAAIDRDESGTQKSVKLLNPQPKVKNTLQMAAMDRFFEIYTDEAAALASFG